LRLLSSPLQDLEGKTTEQLKETVAGLLDSVLLNNEDNEKMQSYDKKIVEYNEEIAKQRPSDPNYQERRRYLKEKIEECRRKKNKVIFMRFLSEKLPLLKISAKRTEIPEADILLSAFGL
jgi:predicted RNase H-like nuclease (RuvC/YqgF family)